mgnify:CR=1 FL=1
MRQNEQGKISTNVNENIEYFNRVLNIDKSFDVLYHIIHIGGRTSVIYFIDGFAKDEVLEKILEHFYKITEDQMSDNAHLMLKEHIPYAEVDLLDDKDSIIQQILSGVPILMIDGFDRAISMDCRSYPARGIDEPEKDKVLRGSRDGFVETLVFNTALVRRRIRSPKLIMEYKTVGQTSRTDVVICYMEDRVNQKLLKKLQTKMDQIDVDALTLNQESMAECLMTSSKWNPFPKYKYSERPDATAACVLEGSIAIFVDNSPAAMILPTTIFDIVEEADDYYFPPITGTYLRLSRFIINFIGVFLTPLFLLLMNNPDMIPESLSFIMVKEEVNVPLLWQFLILEFAIDGLRLASLNTPSMLSTPLSVAAGLIIGDFTVSSGWFNAEAMLYEAFVAISTYTQASYELGYALKFMRLICLILTQIFNVWGFIAGIVLTVLLVCFTKTFSGRSYIYPLIPFDGRNLLHRFFRQSIISADKHQKD